MHDVCSLVLGNIECLIKSTEHVKPINSSFSLAKINGQNVILGPIGAPSSDPVHPFYPDLVHGSTTQVVPSDHSYIYIARIYCNHVHDGEVSQLRDEESVSLMPYLCHSQSLIVEEEVPASHLAQVGSLINPSSSPIQEEPYVLDSQLDQTSGFSDSHFTINIFAHASGDYPTYPFVDPMKPP